MVSFSGSSHRGGSTSAPPSRESRESSVECLIVVDAVCGWKSRGGFGWSACPAPCLVVVCLAARMLSALIRSLSTLCAALVRSLRKLRSVSGIATSQARHVLTGTAKLRAAALLDRRRDPLNPSQKPPTQSSKLADGTSAAAAAPHAVPADAHSWALRSSLAPTPTTTASPLIHCHAIYLSSSPLSSPSPSPFLLFSSVQPRAFSCAT